MKKFRFRLQTLLKLRKQQEDQKKRAVALLLSQINDLQQQALIMAADLKKEGENLRKIFQSGSIDLNRIAHYHRYVHNIQQAINQRIQNVSQVQPQLTLARSELTEAAKQTKILEKLKQKQKQKYETELARKERIQQDEIPTFAFLRSEKLG